MAQSDFFEAVRNYHGKIPSIAFFLYGLGLRHHDKWKDANYRVQAVNKRRSGMFDGADEKQLEACCQKAAFLLHNAELHECQARAVQTQTALADKFSGLLLSRTDKFRWVGAKHRLLSHDPAI
eukprot:scaffold64611_cov26-Prasinocladus_malaysianus.AAC.1